MSSNAVKISGALLVFGAIMLFLNFGNQREKSLPFAPSAPPVQDLTLNPTASPAIPNATATSPETRTPSNEIEAKKPTPPVTQNQTSRPEGEARPAVAATQLTKCKFQEFTVEVFSNSRAVPASLTIQAGDTVTFINEDNNLHWPGADPHPTHSGLPSFDATGGISKNQSYSHTFDKAGKFGWHEHLIEDNPPTLGFITVMPCSV